MNEEFISLKFLVGRTQFPVCHIPVPAAPLHCTQLLQVLLQLGMEKNRTEQNRTVLLISAEMFCNDHDQSSSDHLKADQKLKQVFKRSSQTPPKH